MKKFISYLLVTCMILSAVALYGCSSQAPAESSSAAASESAAVSESAAPSESASASESAATGELTKVRLQLKWLSQCQFMGFYVAQEKGYYKDEGIDLEIIPGGPDIVPATQVENGAAEFGIAALNTLIPYEEQGYPLVSVSQLFQDGSFLLLSMKDKNIASPEDLKGKTVGAWLGGNEYPIYALLAKYGIDKDKDLTIAKQDFTMDAFLNGTLDVASATIYNEYHVVLESGVKESDMNIINMNDEGIFMLEDCIFADTDWLKDNKDTTVKFLRATIKGWKDAVADPKGAADITWKYMDQSSSNLDHQYSMAEEIAKLVKPEGFDESKIGFIDTDKLQSTLDISKKYGLIKEVPETIYDESYLKEAVAE